MATSTPQLNPAASIFEMFIELPFIDEGKTPSLVTLAPAGDGVQYGFLRLLCSDAKSRQATTLSDYLRG
jgi:hypothetical protein